MGIYSQARAFINESQDQDSYSDDYKDIDIIGTLMEAETEIKRVDQLVFESLLELDFVSIVEGEEENKDSSDSSSDDGKKANKIIEAFKTIWRKVKEAIVKAWNAFLQKMQEIFNSKALLNVDKNYEMIKKSGIKEIKVEDMKLGNDYGFGFGVNGVSFRGYKNSMSRFITKYIDKFKSLKFENDNELDDFLDELNHETNIEKEIHYSHSTSKNNATIDLKQLNNVVYRLKKLKEENVIKEIKNYIKKIEQDLNQILNEVSKSKNNDNVAARKYKAGTKLLSAISEEEKVTIMHIKSIMSADRKIFIAFVIEAKKANKKGNDNTDNTTDSTSTGESTDLTSSIIDLESDLYMESIFGF